MSEFTRRQIDLMRRACLLCDSSELEVRTGCVVVLGGDVVGEGWNREVVHAEVMAVKNAKKREDELDGAVVYVSRFPCVDCANMLVGEGVRKVFYMSDHFTSGNKALPIFESAGVEVVQIPEDVVWDRKE